MYGISYYDEKDAKKMEKDIADVYTSPGGKEKYWDYLGAPYPLGVLEPNKNLLFDREQIEKVVFTGYSDEEGKKVIDFLNNRDKEDNV